MIKLLAKIAAKIHQLFLQKTAIIDLRQNFNTFCAVLEQREKINLNFYFRTSLCCLKGFHKEV